MHYIWIELTFVLAIFYHTDNSRLFCEIVRILHLFIALIKYESIS